MRGEDRDETYPEDEQFFEQVADAVSAGGGSSSSVTERARATRPIT